MTIENRDRVWIFGAGETGRLFGHYIGALRGVQVVGYVVEDKYFQGETKWGKPVVPYSRWSGICQPWDYVIIAITGFLENKERIFQELSSQGHPFFTYVHPQTFIDESATIGQGCFIFENNVVQSGVTIGNNTILWSGNHIGHQTTIGNHCFIASHAVLCGGVTVANRCFIGVNAAVAPNVTIKSGAFIGMGVNITRGVESNEKIRGVDTRDVVVTNSSLQFG